MDSKQHKARILPCLMFLLVVGLFQTFVFEFDVMIVVNRFFYSVTCCKPVSLKNCFFLGGGDQNLKLSSLFFNNNSLKSNKESLFDFSVWPNYREQTESEKCT